MAVKIGEAVGQPGSISLAMNRRRDVCGFGGQGECGVGKGGEELKYLQAEKKQTKLWPEEDIRSRRGGR